MSASASSTPTLEGSCVAPTFFKLGIDVRTSDSTELMARLTKLDSTVSVSFGGQYREDPIWAQVHVETTLTEAQLDAWLYAGEGIDYVGVFQR